MIEKKKENMKVKKILSIYSTKEFSHILFSVHIRIYMNFRLDNNARISVNTPSSNLIFETVINGFCISSIGLFL